MTVRKIGFIDYFLDEWHANNYPAWIRESAAATGLEWEVAYAWAEIDKPEGLTTDQWCAQHGVERVGTIEELVAKSDAIIVLSPDHPEHHERLAQLALQSGKPVYMDKTFAPDLLAAKRLFQQAAAGGTPLFSSSALRFAEELQAQVASGDSGSVSGPIAYLAVSGPGKYTNYAVHQFEMIVTLMGTGARRVKSLSNAHGRQLAIEFDAGSQASFLQLDHAPFQAIIQREGGEGAFIGQCSNMFARLMDAILAFFETRVVPVSPEQTLAVIALIDAGRTALEQRDEWVDVASLV